MARCFGLVDIAAFISAYGVFGYVFDIGFVESAHAFRQRKNRQPVYAVMGEKSP